MKQRDVTELLARADDLAIQNKSYQEVYAAMAQSLSEAWVDLNKQLDYRKMLLDQSINFHESALQVRARLFSITTYTGMDLILAIEATKMTPLFMYFVLQATLSKLLTYCVLRSTQPPTLSGMGNE